MSENDSGFKRFLEFLSNTKMIIEILFALSVGKLFQSVIQIQSQDLRGRFCHMGPN